VCEGSGQKRNGKKRLVDKNASRGHCHKSFLLTLAISLCGKLGNARTSVPCCALTRG
jgi:hypothetical protein